jgi:hypothetical protein
VESERNECPVDDKSRMKINELKKFNELSKALKRNVKSILKRAYR